MLNLKHYILIPEIRLEKFVENTSPVPSTPEPPGLDCTIVSADAESGRDSPVDVSSTSESGIVGRTRPESAPSGGRRSPSRNPLLQERCTCEELANVVCHLETKDLWDNAKGTLQALSTIGFRLCPDYHRIFARSRIGTKDT
ncbi:unnamed protein product [Phaedon cochleariae]|uniref:Uncharacterized protein n=1 Tax=Phaedon cochleariae TaxID=80249 RepID=A0A9N9SKD7_PHACE|nr:unnamed protein product [Phaedon cochleariae]